jgi:hypothetical protein
VKRRFKDLFLHLRSAGALPAAVSWFRETNPLPANASPIESMASSVPYSALLPYNNAHHTVQLERVSSCDDSLTTMLVNLMNGCPHVHSAKLFDLSQHLCQL